MCSFFTLKKCSECQLEKIPADFSKKCTKADGTLKHESRCKLCKKSTDRIRNQKKKNLKKKQHNDIREFTYAFSLATEGPDLKGAIDICTTLTKTQDNY